MERQRYYTAAEGMTYRRKVDNVIVGRTLYLGKFIDGSVDVIENYEEIVDEELKKRNEEREKKREELKKRHEERWEEMREKMLKDQNNNEENQ